MRIAIDVSPLQKDRFLQHRVRGTGFYIENLKKSLIKYFPENKYIFFTRGEKLPKNLDLVHYPYFEPFFLTLPMFNKHRLVVTVHDLTPLVFPENFPAGVKGKIKWEIQKKSLYNSSEIITDSFSSKKDIEKIVGIEDNRIHVVYLAQDQDFKKIMVPKNEAEDIRKRYNLPEKFTLYVGDVTWNKNLPNLIKAINLINANLVMVGYALSQEKIDINNPWNSDLVEVQELVEGNRNVNVIGFVEKKDLIKIYNMAEIFVMPSIYEGFGLPVLEAANCGCPVVTTRCGSLPEIIGESAVFVDPKDIEDIANGIDKVLSNKTLRDKLSKDGLKQAEKFSWHNTAEKTINVYEKVFRQQ
ncbi:MAG: hypothetical protein A2857_02690 [Candidatus Levybacteria bacterium RIFCSPHIGHO2_01_FULL_36_15]|nr:MAG: hypothetical protein A2857_02690 [Candidatus Levybacteria bacterium RIFCSPHIGHO2_01_FULL_36_15]OGH38442.1 MAG: hypothetical protein A2905_01370 [Candidatus Levybacteria bacterium RIFCSPLOWO2_01_FULL_36_10]